MNQKLSESMKGNRNGEVHGGGAAEHALSKGQEFTGLGAESLSAVRAEYNQVGVTGLLETRALRVQAVADLFFSAIMGAAQDQDLKKLITYVDKFGWLQNSAIRALVALRDSKGKEDTVSEAEVLRSLQAEYRTRPDQAEDQESAGQGSEETSA